MELNICHLYPDSLNLYGDRGNIITMKRRLESRGISVNVDECSIGQPLDVDKYMEIGIITRKNTTLTRYGRAYIDAIRQHI